MAIAKVIVNGSTRLDLTADTVSESSLLSTYTAHDSTGEAVVGSIVASIVVEYPAGSTCTCSNGTKTFTAKDTSGTAVFSIPSNGLWAVTATDGSNTQSRTVTISYKGQGETVYINYAIPTTYKRLEYIGTSGTQRIYMTLPSSRNVYGLRYKADIFFPTPASTTNQDFMADTNSQPYFVLLWYGWSHLYPTCASNGASAGTAKDELFGTRFLYEADGTGSNLVITANGEPWYTGTKYTRNLSGFGLFYDYGDTRHFITCKLYSLQIFDTDGTTLLRDLYPVMRLEDNVTGLYDTVSGTFFTNAGSGIFTFAEYGSGQ